MQRFSLVRALLLMGAAGLLVSCDTPADAEDGVEESRLTFVRMTPGAPPLEALEASFWAVRGEEREVQIRYQDPRYGFGKCLRFVVPARAIPAGIAPGDSVRITVRVPDPSAFRFEFQPAGLRFEAGNAARMEIRYTYYDQDLNADGAVDERDRRLAERLAIWRQERPGEPWYRLPTALHGSVLEAQAEVRGFTIFVLASD